MSPYFAKINYHISTLITVCTQHIEYPLVATPGAEVMGWWLRDGEMKADTGQFQQPPKSDDSPLSDWYLTGI